MKTRISLAVLATLVLATAAQAQKPGVLGIGIAVGPADLGASSDDTPPMSSIMFPMNFGAFRLEPSLGFSGANIEFNDPFIGSDKESVSAMELGVGVYYQTSMGNGFSMYGGPRFGILRSSQTSETSGNPEESMTETDKFFGVALGGEHFFSSHFSLGAEARLTHFVAGEPKFKPDTGGDSDFKASATTTNGYLVARFYF